VRCTVSYIDSSIASRGWPIAWVPATSIAPAGPLISEASRAAAAWSPPPTARSTARTRCSPGMRTASIVIHL